jgi:hypothetical protein
LSWLRKSPTKVSGSSFVETIDKLDKVRSIGVGALDLPPEIGARMQQMVREGLRFTAQAFQPTFPGSRIVARPGSSLRAS